MQRILKGSAPLAMTFMLAACVNTPAPTYQASIANLQTLRAGTTLIGVDDFSAAAGVNDRSLNMRGSSMTGTGQDGAFSTYLQDALVTELRNAGRFDDAAALRLSGTLTVNRLSAEGFSTGNATAGARFVLTRDGRVVYDKVITAQHEWESSFIGAIAIPAAVQGYPATVQKLVSQLFTDPAFIEATR